uniref:Uncharacterized protein n=1 Tax=Photinus pyralis TaxID=7054 RepID=A0A1Y1LE82_PHOPY
MMNNERKIKDFSELTTRQQRRRVLSHLHLHHRSVHASQLSSTDIVHSTQETTQEPIPSTSKAVTIDEHSEIFDSTLSSSTLSTADASIKSSDISVYHPVSSHKIVSNFESDLRALIIKHHDSTRSRQNDVSAISQIIQETQKTAEYISWWSITFRIDTTYTRFFFFQFAMYFWLKKLNCS